MKSAAQAPVLAELGVDVGVRFGRLLIKEWVGGPGLVTKWRCACDCGGEVTLATYRLKQTKTPGCRQCSTARQALAKAKHGDFMGSKGRKTRLWRTWASMHERCNPGRHSSPRGWDIYLAKGIVVCPEWSDFAVFRDWARANGYADDLTIERKSSWGNYDPGNCEWITKAENSRRAGAATAAKNKWEAPMRPWVDPHFPIEMLWGAC
jgi:hypothetical protein